MQDFVSAEAVVAAVDCVVAEAVVAAVDCVAAEAVVAAVDCVAAEANFFRPYSNFRGSVYYDFQNIPALQRSLNGPMI